MSDHSTNPDRPAHQVTAGELLALCARVLESGGLTTEVALGASQEFVAAELCGHRTHGTAKLVSLNLGDTDAVPTVERQGAVVRVDGQRGNGFVTMRTACSEALAGAREHGVALVAVTRYSRYAGLWPYTSWLAGHGLVALLTNTAGPSHVAPHGATSKVTGTNPVSVSFPTGDGRTHTVDLATSEQAWGEIRLAAFEQRPLSRGPFLDAYGQVTVEPLEVDAVRAFGGAKGSALNFAVELLAGALVGAPVGAHVQDEFDCGALLLAVDPGATAPGGGVPAAVADLVAQVQSAVPEYGEGPVRCPGERAGDQVVLDERLDEVLSIPATTWDQLVDLAHGRS